MMKHLVYNLHKSTVCRFFPTSRTMCAKASSSMSLPTKIIDNNSAKLIYSVASSVGHGTDGHTELDSRFPWCLEHLETLINPKFRGSEMIQLENFRMATVEDIATIHSRSYISFIEMETKKASEQGALPIEMETKKASEQGALPFEDSGPTYTTYATATTYAEALRAVGAGLSIVDSVVAASKDNDNPPVGFALTRPHGHHALPNRAMGFCVFNNVAIATRHVQRVHGLKRVFIIDFDAHHGNGTSDIFYDDPDVFYLSTHEEGGFPGTGKFDDVGCGNGEGATLNLPLPEGSGDITMQFVFDYVIAPVAQRFKPDIILVSAGFNGHLLDPVAGFQFNSGTYHMLASNIKQLAKDLCGGRCVFFLEGGYSILGHPHSIAESFHALIGEPSMADKLDESYKQIFANEPRDEVIDAILRIKCLHSI